MQKINSNLNNTDKQNINLFKSNTKSKSLTTVRNLVTQIDDFYKKRPQSLRKRQVVLDRQQIRKQMKQKWKDPGFCNVEFSNYKALKGKFLNQWEIQRIFLAQRSYQTPKDFKGFKQTYQSREFPKVPKQVYSEKFQKYLSKIEEHSQTIPSDSRKLYTQASTYQDRNIRKLNSLKKTFQAFSSQNKPFGMGTVTWKKGDSSKLKTLQY